MKDILFKISDYNKDYNKDPETGYSMKTIDAFQTHEVKK